MRVALITEGTYPFVHGGVSVWCDRLIRQLPDVEFALYAVPPGAHSDPVWDLPENVTSTALIQLEPTSTHKFHRYSKKARRQFLDAYDAVLTATLEQPTPNEDRFLEALRALRLACQEIPIDLGVRSSKAFDITYGIWTERSVGDRLDLMGAPSLDEVLQVTSSLSRFLRPLEVTPIGDVAHATANGLSSISALAAKWAYDTPILLTEHGVYLRERYLEAQKSDIAERVKAFLLMFFRRLNNATLQMSDLISPVSNYNRRWELETGALDERIITIHNGVDPELFPAIEGEPDIPTVSWLGRVDPLKDVVTLIESFVWVREAVPDARLRLFGPIPVGNKAYHEKCLAAINERDLGDVVSFEGLISPASKAFEAGHVVALSSISEGFPFTVLEAMMSGRATVSTDVGGVSEAVGDAGLLVPPREPELMGKALARLLKDSKLRLELGRMARERALELFTLSKMSHEYLELYESLTEGGQAVDATVRRLWDA